MIHLSQCSRPTFVTGTLIAAALCLAAGPKQTVRVVGVHDGDTITCLTAEMQQLKVRLDAIDAPELGQPFGQAAKKALSEMVFGKDVVVVPKKIDRYGRTIGHVIVDGQDINMEMLEAGMAWHYKYFDQNKRLADAERSAKVVRKGLWSDGNPVPPWEWRQAKRSQTEFKTRSRSQ